MMAGGFLPYHEPSSKYIHNQLIVPSSNSINEHRLGNWLLPRSIMYRLDT